MWRKEAIVIIQVREEYKGKQIGLNDRLSMETNKKKMSKDGI